jgi:predicted nucleic acid-binding protein
MTHFAVGCATSRSVPGRRAIIAKDDMMQVYLDTCSLQRPLDSKTQSRIALEAEAVLAILALCSAGDAELFSSDVLVFEIECNPNPVRREYAHEAITAAKQLIVLDEQIENRAAELTAIGFKPLDALHLASAEAARVQYFCTCDDRLLKKAKAYPYLGIRVLSPVEVIEEISP